MALVSSLVWTVSCTDSSRLGELGDRAGSTILQLYVATFSVKTPSLGEGGFCDFFDFSRFCEKLKRLLKEPHHLISNGIF